MLRSKTQLRREHGKRNYFMGKLDDRVGSGAIDVVFDAEDDDSLRSGVCSTKSNRNKGQNSDTKVSFRL